MRRLDYAGDEIKNIDALVQEAFGKVDESSQRIIETLYYIAGWTLDAMMKIVIRRKKKLGTPLTYLVCLCSVESTFAQSGNLPTGKVDSIVAFGALKYASKDYFTFITCMECVFSNLLSIEQLIIHGPFLMNEILKSLLNNEAVISMFSKFIPTETDVMIKKIV